MGLLTAENALIAVVFVLAIVFGYNFGMQILN